MIPRLVHKIEGGYPERDGGAEEEEEQEEEGQGWGDSRRLIVMFERVQIRGHIPEEFNIQR